MTSNAFTAITVLLPELCDYELDILYSLVAKTRKDRDFIKDYENELTEEEDDHSLEEEEGLKWENKTLDELIKENEEFNVKYWKNQTLDDFMNQDEEEYEGDSLPEPHITKEELDKQLEEFSRIINSY